MIDLAIAGASPPEFKPNSKCFLEYCFIYPVRFEAPDRPPWFKHESAMTNVGRFTNSSVGKDQYPE
eukprot:5719213-Amphidinium_carterae.1